MTTSQQQQQLSLETPQVVQAYKDETTGKIWIKTFLSNSLLNKQGWTIDGREEKLKQFEGKPGLLTPINYHPVYHKEMSDIIRVATKQGSKNLTRLELAKLMEEYQKKYSVTTIRKIEKDTISDVDGYSAYHEVTNPEFEKLYYQKKMPLYVSPTVFNLDEEEPKDGIIRNYYPLHIAFVNNPAWPETQAIVKGTCVGDMQSCFKGLAQAAIKSATANQLREIADKQLEGSDMNCGFCIETAANEFTNKLPEEKYTSLLEINTKQGSTREMSEQQQVQTENKEGETVKKTTTEEVSKAPVNVKTNNDQTKESSKEPKEPDNIERPDGSDSEGDESDEEAKMRKIVEMVAKHLGIDELKKFYEEFRRKEQAAFKQQINDKLARFLTAENYKGDDKKLAEEKQKFEIIANKIAGEKLNPNDEFDLLDFILQKTFGRAPAEVLAAQQEIKKKTKQGAQQPPSDFVERTIAVGAGDSNIEKKLPQRGSAFHNVDIF